MIRSIPSVLLLALVAVGCPKGDPCGELMRDPVTESCVCPDGFTARPELGICEGPDGSVPVDAEQPTLDSGTDADASDGATCSDGIANGTETDVDCGGDCDPCETEMMCARDGDCTTEVCVSGVCRSRYLKASNTGGGDWFGEAVALSGDGSTVAVGALREASCFLDSPSDDGCLGAGAVYVYRRSASGQWQFDAYLKSAMPDRDDAFGGSVALSTDGSVLAVSASRNDSCGADPGDDGCEDAGAVYVFKRTGAMWTRSGYLHSPTAERRDFFGAGLAISGSGRTIAVGAPGEDSCARGIASTAAPDNSCSSAGAVFLFRDSADAWTMSEYMKSAAPTGAGIDFDFFGTSLALSEDGTTMVVGAPGEASCANGVDPPGGVSDDGCEGAGAAYVFVNEGGAGWRQDAFVKSSNSSDLSAFGEVVALSADGTRLVVGAEGQPSCADGLNPIEVAGVCGLAGAAYVFEVSGGAWTELYFVKATNSEPEDRFGASVALSADGAIILVGAPLEDGCGMGSGADDGNNECADGGAVFSIEATELASVTYLKPSAIDAGDRFGEAVAISSDGSLAVVCSRSEASGATGVDGDFTDNSRVDAGGCFFLYREARGIWR